MYDSCTYNLFLGKITDVNVIYVIGPSSGAPLPLPRHSAGRRVRDAHGPRVARHRGGLPAGMNPGSVENMPKLGKSSFQRSLF